jgi:limonene-1,2-epoxide hydrolase
MACPASRDVVRSFWSAMQDNDWPRAASHLADGCEVDWPCSGERIVGRDDFVAIQIGYPTNTGRWSFDLHRMIVDGGTVVSELTVTDGEQSARAIVFSEVAGEQIVRQVEYWPAPYAPAPWREHLVRRIDQVP